MVLSLSLSLGFVVWTLKNKLHISSLDVVDVGRLLGFVGAGSKLGDSIVGT